MTTICTGSISIELGVENSGRVSHYFGVWHKPEDAVDQLLKAAKFLQNLAGSLDGNTSSVNTGDASSANAQQPE